MRSQQARSDAQLLLPLVESLLRSSEQPRGGGRIHAKRTSDADQVCLARSQRFVHRRDRAKAAGDHQRHFCPVLHGAGIFQEISLPRLRGCGDRLIEGRFKPLLVHHFRLFIVPAGNLHKINVQCVERVDHAEAVLEAEAAFLEVCRVQLHRNGEARPAGDLRFFHAGDQQSCPVFKRTAPFVLTPIGQRRQEGGQQIPMGSMDLNAVKPCLFRDFRRPAEAFNHRLDFLHSHGAGLPELAARQSERHRARRGGPGVYQFRRLAPGMADLHDQRRAMTFRRLGPAGEAVQRLVRNLRPDDDIAHLLKVIVVDLDVAGDDAAEPAFGPAPVERDMRLSDPIARISQSLCHCRFHKTVGKCQPAGQG